MPGAITIATNMAGRGTDIQLGGNAKMRVERELAGLEGEERARREKEILDEVASFKEKALAAGGLYVLGTERHESRRCSNTTLRWSFMTLSYFRMFLRMSKLRASTLPCAFSIALLIHA